MRVITLLIEYNIYNMCCKGLLAVMKDYSKIYNLEILSNLRGLFYENGISMYPFYVVIIIIYGF